MFRDKRGLMILALSLIAVLAISLMAAGCGPTPTPQILEKEVVVTATPVPTPKVTRPLVWATSTEAVSLDPCVNRYWYSRLAQRGPYEPLNEYHQKEDGTFELVPMLATDWEVSGDGLTYTYHLRKGVEFTDGTPFNAEAAKYNIERCLAIGMVPSGWLKPIKKIETPDEYTLQITIEKPHAAFLWEMSFQHFVSPTAAKEHEVEGDWGQKWLHEHAVGTGPYLLDSWEHGEQITLVKNPDWWGGAENVAVEKVIVKLIPDVTTRKLMLMKGDVDVAERIRSAADLFELARTPGVVVKENPGGGGIVTLQIRNRGPLADKRVRKAIALAFDYQGFVDRVLQGMAKVPNGPLIEGAEWGWDESLPRFQKDLEKARELLAEAGYPDGLPEPLELGIISSYQFFQRDEAQILQAGLAELGIDLKISDFADVSAYLAAIHPPDGDIEKGPDLYAWTYNTPHGDPDNNLRQYHCDYHPPAGMAGSFYCNREVSDLIDAADAETDQAKRLEMIKEIQKMIAEDQPAIWTARITDFVTYRDWVKGYHKILGGHRAGRYYEISLTQ